MVASAKPEKSGSIKGPISYNLPKYLCFFFRLSDQSLFTVQITDFKKLWYIRGMRDIKNTQ